MKIPTPGGLKAQQADYVDGVEDEDGTMMTMESID